MLMELALVVFAEGEVRDGSNNNNCAFSTNAWHESLVHFDTHVTDYSQNE